MKGFFQICFLLLLAVSASALQDGYAKYVRHSARRDRHLEILVYDRSARTKVFRLDAGPVKERLGFDLSPEDPLAPLSRL